MMRSQRKAAPLAVLLGFEVAAIVGLQALGSSHTMQVPWSNLSTWLDTSSIDQLAPPVVRLAALGLSYWMFVSTALCVIAQVSRIPSAIQAASLFTLPSVRRVVDGAMVMSIATTSLVGVTGTAAFASDAPQVPTSGDITTTIAATSDDLSVPTPSPDGVTSTTDPSAVTTVGDDSSTTAAPDTTTTAAPDPSSTVTSTTASDPTAVAPTAGDDWVPTPGPRAVDTTSTTALSTTTTVPQGPSTPANTPSPGPSTSTPAPAPGTQVLAETEHRVVHGDNLWNISRDAIAASTNTPVSQISESQIRDYWLKVIDANVGNLRSHDPHWIMPGEIITLPPLGAPSTSGS